MEALRSYLEKYLGYGTFLKLHKELEIFLKIQNEDKVKSLYFNFLHQLNTLCFFQPMSHWIFVKKQKCFEASKKTTWR